MENTPTHLRFVDDILIFSHTPEELQGMIQEIAKESIKAGLNMNMKKIKVMISNNTQNHKISVQGKDLEIIDHYSIWARRSPSTMKQERKQREGSS